MMPQLTHALETVAPRQRLLVQSLLREMPEAIWAQSAIRHLLPGQALLMNGEPAEEVFVHLSGRLMGQDMYTSGNLYRFIQLEPVNIIGEFEAFSNRSAFLITIEASTDVRVLTLPKDAFLCWMHQDHAALLQITHWMADKLTEEPKVNRQYLFMRAPQRVMHYLHEKCTALESAERSIPIFDIWKTHGEIAEETGLSVKTIDRALRELESENLLSRAHKRVTVTRAQLAKMKERLPK